MSPNKLVLGLIAVVFVASSLQCNVRADEFGRIRAENEVAKQKLLRDVEAALALARKFEASDPLQARDAIRSAQSKLEADSLLPKSERDRLLSTLSNRLVIVNDAVRSKQRDDELAAQREAKNLEQQFKQPPSSPVRNPSEVASGRINDGKLALDANYMDRIRQETGRNNVQRDLDHAASQITEERITQHFINVTDRRKPRLSKEEQHVMKMLNSTMSIDFTNARFKEVIEYLQERTEMPIILDEGSLRDAGVQYDDPVTFKAPKVQVRTILRKVLGDRGLSYFVKEGAIQVVTIQQARETMVVRTYPVGELINVNPAFGPFMGRAIMYQQVQQLINTVQASMDPTIWQQGGSIQFLEAPVPTLVIRAPAELHYSLSKFGN